MEQECHLHLKVLAPRGLSGIERHLAHCKMGLIPHVSGFTGQVILFSQMDEERFEFNMDPSLTDVLVASGNMFLPEEEAWQLLLSLSDVLKRAGFPHKLGMDDPIGQRSTWVSYEWPSDEGARR